MMGGAWYVLLLKQHPQIKFEFEFEFGISPRFAVGIVVVRSTYNVVLNWLRGQQRPKKSLGTRQVA